MEEYTFGPTKSGKDMVDIISKLEPRHRKYVTKRVQTILSNVNRGCNEFKLLKNKQVIQLTLNHWKKYWCDFTHSAPIPLKCKTHTCSIIVGQCREILRTISVKE